MELASFIKHEGEPLTIAELARAPSSAIPFRQGLRDTVFKRKSHNARRSHRLRFRLRPSGAALQGMGVDYLTPLDGTDAPAPGRGFAKIDAAIDGTGSRRSRSQDARRAQTWQSLNKRHDCLLPPDGPGPCSCRQHRPTRGQWLEDKHDARSHGTWRKLHLALDVDRGEVIAHTMTEQDGGDATAGPGRFTLSRRKSPSLAPSSTAPLPAHARNPPAAKERPHRQPHQRPGSRQSPHPCTGALQRDFQQPHSATEQAAIHPDEIARRSNSSLLNVPSPVRKTVATHLERSMAATDL